MASNDRSEGPTNSETSRTRLERRKDGQDLYGSDYDVSQLYKKQGMAQKIARSEHFQTVTLAVITLNAVYLGIDADNNHAETLATAALPYRVCEHLFCVFFLGELLLRAAAFARKSHWFVDGWFKFDSALVMLMVTETWLLPLMSAGLPLPTGPLRLLRLLRLSRMIRMMRSAPELVTMIRGLRAACRAVASSLLMVLILIYVFAIVLHMTLKDETSLASNFSSLPRCMYTLMAQGTLMDNVGDIMWPLIEMQTPNAVVGLVIFMSYILLATMTVLNMLIGVLCEVVSSVSKAERDDAAIALVKDAILEELQKFDDNGNGMISFAELEQVMQCPHAIEILQGLEVDTDSLKGLQECLFTPACPEVPIGDIMELLLDYRGNLQTTVRHVVDSSSLVRKELLAALQDQDRKLCVRLDKILGRMDTLQAGISAGPGLEAAPATLRVKAAAAREAPECEAVRASAPLGGHAIDESQRGCVVPLPL